MEKYTFNQSRKVITVEKTTMDIQASSFEEALEKARKLSPFSEHEYAMEEDYLVTEVELIELDPEDNNAEATVETWYGDKFLFDNIPDTETIHSRLKRLMNEGPMVAFYICTGVEYMKRCLDLKTDDEVYNDFCGLYHSTKIRNNVNYIHQVLYPEQLEENQTINSSL